MDDEIPPEIARAIGLYCAVRVHTPIVWGDEDTMLKIKAILHLADGFAGFISTGEIPLPLP